MNILKKNWKILAADKISGYSTGIGLISSLGYYLIDSRHYGIPIAIMGAGVTGAVVSYLDKKRIYKTIKKEIKQIDLKSSNLIHNSWFDKLNPALENLVILACSELEEESLKDSNVKTDYTSLYTRSKERAENGFFASE